MWGFGECGTPRAPRAWKLLALFPYLALCNNSIWLFLSYILSSLTGDLAGYPKDVEQEDAAETVKTRENESFVILTRL